MVSDERDTAVRNMKLGGIMHCSVGDVVEVVIDGSGRDVVFVQDLLLSMSGAMMLIFSSESMTVKIILIRKKYCKYHLILIMNIIISS